MKKRKKFDTSEQQHLYKELKMVPIYFAFPNLKEWKNIPGGKYKDEYDLLNRLEFQFDREKNAFYPRLKVLPEHNLFKHFPTPIFGHIWVDDADFELLKKQKIYIYYGGGMTVPAVMDWYFITEVPKDGRKVKVIWDDQKIDEFALTEAGPKTRNDGGYINSGLAMISNGVNILFLHPDFFSENIMKNRIGFTKEREIPVLTEEIIKTRDTISFRTVLRSDYREKSFVRIQQKIEINPISRNPFLIVGEYRIAQNDLIVGFYSSPEGIRFSVHKVYHVDRSDHKKPEVHSALRFFYDGICWNHPSPPEKVLNLFKDLQARASTIMESPIEEYKGSVLDDII